MPTEYKFEFCVYPLDEREAERLREEIQKWILSLVDHEGKFMGPVTMEVVDGETAKS